MIQKLFDQLDKWRHFPAYQLERRADIFFAIYLKDIFKAKYNKSLDVIIPEFPVQRGSIYPNTNDNKSVKIDYLAVDQAANEVFLIELKTDMNSRREKQDLDLKKARDLNVPGLMVGIQQIYNATKQKAKYDFLIQELIQLGWLNKEGKTLIDISNANKTSIIYIQPTNNDDDENIICFDDIINILKTKEDEFSIRFASSLLEWKANLNN